MYYAEYCPWGTNISYESMGGDAYRFFAFEDKTDRDNFVNEHYWDENTYAGCWASVSRKTVERQCGKNFVLVATDGPWYVDEADIEIKECLSARRADLSTRGADYR